MATSFIGRDFRVISKIQSVLKALHSFVISYWKSSKPHVPISVFVFLLCSVPLILAYNLFPLNDWRNTSKFIQRILYYQIFDLHLLYLLIKFFLHLASLKMKLSYVSQFSRWNRLCGVVMVMTSIHCHFFYIISEVYWELRMLFVLSHFHLIFYR